MKKPIYNIFTLTARNLILSLALVSAIQAQGADGEVTTGELSAEALEGLKLQIVSPMTSGAETLTANDALERYFEIDGSNVIVHLNGLAEGQHRLTVKMHYGTQVEVLAIFDLIVPANLAAGDDEREVQISAVETIGDGSGTQITVDQEIIEGSTNPVAGGAVYGELQGRADAAVYAKDGDGNAHITKPLNVSGSVQEGSPYSTNIYELNVVVLTSEQKAEVEAETGTAYDYCDTNDGIPDGVNVTIYADDAFTQKVGSTAKTEYADTPMGGDFFNLQNGESISAGTYYAREERGTIGENSHAEGDSTTASGKNSHAEGFGTTASGENSHAEGAGTTASEFNSHAEGDSTTASGVNSHAEGVGTTASGKNSHAEGFGTTASGENSHAEGVGTTASGGNSHAEGAGATASGDNSHAEGVGTTASGENSHAEGDSTTASGFKSHAEGNGTIASGFNSHAEGVGTTASEKNSHAEGSGTTASGGNSHAEGVETTASGFNSHAEGNGTIASGADQHVCGRFNVEDTNGDYALIVGNGANEQNRSNAFAIDWNGNLVLFNSGTPVVLTPAKLAQLIA